MLVTKMLNALTLLGVTTALAEIDSVEMVISVKVSAFTTHFVIDTGIKSNNPILHRY